MINSNNVQIAARKKKAWALKEYKYKGLDSLDPILNEMMVFPVDFDQGD